ncbi:MAG TPA: DUF4235 domain-containing protein [Jatrophihabitans sp.]|jgi:hypothetical protein|nr:DUF4235 domain-containing protein [Jatrophihabitans sp.]
MAVAGKIGLKLVSAAIGIPIGIASKKLVERAWLAARPEDPPRKPAEPEVRWADAVSWAALSAIGIVVAELITRRSAEATYRALTGSEPPPRRPDKHAKNASKEAAAARASA